MNIVLNICGADCRIVHTATCTDVKAMVKEIKRFTKYKNVVRAQRSTSGLCVMLLTARKKEWSASVNCSHDEAARLLFALLS